VTIRFPFRATIAPPRYSGKLRVRAPADLGYDRRERRGLAMTGPAQKNAPGAGLLIALFAVTLAAIGGATYYVSIRLDALDEHVQTARIAAEEAESAAGAAAQNSANFRAGLAQAKPEDAPALVCAYGAPDAQGLCPEAPPAPGAAGGKPSR
jgi:hypothetical protein